MALRRTLIALVAILTLTAGRADALTIRDIIELSKAGLGDSVLIALIEVDRRVFSIDTDTLKRLKEGGVSDAVIVAMIRSGRSTPIEPVPAAAPPQTPLHTPDPDPAPTREPQVIVIDHHQPQPAQPPVLVPIGISVPGYFPTSPFLNANRRGRHETVTTVLPTDQGLVKARVPVPSNCIKAEPVYWGFGGKLRPGSWQPPPTVVCR